MSPCSIGFNNLEPVSTVKKTKIMALDCDQQIGPASHCLHRKRWQ